MDLLTRSIAGQEIRADEDQGIIEGYFIVWDTVDSYKSKFQRGCCTKTLQERGNKVKVLWNHNDDQVIGVPEIHEDDKGMFVRAKLLVDDIQQAKETFALAKAGAIDSFSFGFRTVKNKFEHGVEIIQEIMLAEVSPVVFEANGAAEITAVRATEFNDTELFDRGNSLLMSFYRTLDDIYWMMEGQEAVNAVSTSIDQFKQQYVSWYQEVADTSAQREYKNELSERAGKYIDDNGGIDQLVKTLPITETELRTLRNGSYVAVKGSIECLPNDIQEANKAERSKAVETLCDEMRAGILPAEANRMTTLLSKSLEPTFKADEMIDGMQNFRKSLEG